jgi:hypothetical protein
LGGRLQQPQQQLVATLRDLIVVASLIAHAGENIPMFRSGKVAEPRAATYREMGRLCVAWSNLEGRSEATLWGILDADERLGPVITWRLDLRGRWQMILEHAPKKHNRQEVEEFRGINRRLIPVMRDRNIIIHGLVHASLEVEGEPKSGDIIHGPLRFVRPACWTVFRGSEAGKSFPISEDAVVIVRDNINFLAEQVIALNRRHGYTKHTLPTDQIDVTP